MRWEAWVLISFAVLEVADKIRCLGRPVKALPPSMAVVLGLLTGAAIQAFLVIRLGVA